MKTKAVPTKMSPISSLRLLWPCPVQRTVRYTMSSSAAHNVSADHIANCFRIFVKSPSLTHGYFIAGHITSALLAYVMNECIADHFAITLLRKIDIAAKLLSKAIEDPKISFVS